jgi:hypothetical protein
VPSDQGSAQQVRIRNLILVLGTLYLAAVDLGDVLSMRNLIRLLSLFMLTSCGIADHFEAESRMNASQDAYRKCLGGNLGQPILCDPLKAVYEQDKAEFGR